LAQLVGSDQAVLVLVVGHRPRADLGVERLGLRRVVYQEAAEGGRQAKEHGTEVKSFCLDGLGGFMDNNGLVD